MGGGGRAHVPRTHRATSAPQATQHICDTLSDRGVGGQAWLVLHRCLKMTRLNSVPAYLRLRGGTGSTAVGRLAACGCRPRTARWKTFGARSRGVRRELKDSRRPRSVKKDFCGRSQPWRHAPRPLACPTRSNADRRAPGCGQIRVKYARIRVITNSPKSDNKLHQTPTVRACENAAPGACASVVEARVLLVVKIQVEGRVARRAYCTL